MKQSTYVRFALTTLMIIVLAVAASALLPTQSVRADLLQNITTGATEFGGTQLGLPENQTDPIQLIAKVLTVLLGFLGVVFLILVLYAGVLWMTALGDPAKVKKAKGIIVTAAIGLAVIVLALAIVQFVTFILAQSVA